MSKKRDVRTNANTNRTFSDEIPHEDLNNANLHIISLSLSLSLYIYIYMSL